MKHHTGGSIPIPFLMHSSFKDLNLLLWFGKRLLCLSKVRISSRLCLYCLLNKQLTVPEQCCTHLAFVCLHCTSLSLIFDDESEFLYRYNLFLLLTLLERNSYSKHSLQQIIIGKSFKSRSINYLYLKFILYLTKLSKYL